MFRSIIRLITRFTFLALGTLGIVMLLSATMVEPLSESIFLPLVLKNFPPSTPVPGGLVNGDFESGRTGWIEYSSNGWILIDDITGLPVTPHGGIWAAWLGGDNDEISIIHQQVVIPLSKPYLCYWYWIDSEDECGYDFGGVVLDTDAVNVYDLCTSTNTGGWTRQVVDLGAYSGQNVELQIRAETDEMLLSNLYIDDVTLASTRPGLTSRVSVASDGTEGNAASDGSHISSDGRFITFASFASNLVVGDTNDVLDVFVHDTQTGETSRVSIASDGTQANEKSRDPVLSSDGRYVVFSSRADNLVIGDTNERDDVFVHDLETGNTDRVSISSDGLEGNDHSSKPWISSDGRYVTFVSSANNLVSDDTNGVSDIFVHDIQVGETIRVSVASNGTQANDNCFNPVISPDGGYVVFFTGANTLVEGDLNGVSDVFLHEVQTGETIRVSVASDGTEGNNYSMESSVSQNGDFVVFRSEATNLVDGDTGSNADIFLHHVPSGVTSRISVAPDGAEADGGSISPFISSTGRYVVFQSYARNLMCGDTNPAEDIFLHDLQEGETFLVSINSNGERANATSHDSSVSSDGRFITFFSYANNLVPGDLNGVKDVFVRELDESFGTVLSDADSSITHNKYYISSYRALPGYILGTDNDSPHRTQRYGHWLNDRVCKKEKLQ